MLQLPAEEDWRNFAASHMAFFLPESAEEKVDVGEVYELIGEHVYYVLLVWR